MHFTIILDDQLFHNWNTGNSIHQGSVFNLFYFHSMLGEPLTLQFSYFSFPQGSHLYFSTVYWRSGRLCADSPQHSEEDSSAESAHHSRSFALQGIVWPRCSDQLWPKNTRGHRSASSHQPHRSVHLSIALVLFNRITVRISIKKSVFLSN